MAQLVPRVNTKPVQYRGGRGGQAGRWAGASKRVGRQTGGRAERQSNNHSLGYINKPASGTDILRSSGMVGKVERGRDILGSGRENLYT